MSHDRKRRRSANTGMRLKSRPKAKLYEKTVIDFAAKENGRFFVLSTDNTFVRTLRATLNKELVIGSDHIRAMSEEEKLLLELKSPLYKDKKILLMVERVLDGRNTLSLIQKLKILFDNLQVIVLTTEVEKNTLVLLHEIGVSNFITKPVSMDTLIEKIAFTIRPQGKIGQYIDQAKDYLSRKKFDEAIAMADRVLELKPGSAAGLMVKGDSLRAQAKFDQAVTCYQEASANATMYLEPLKRLASIHKDEGRMEEQLEYLEKLDTLSPLNVERKIDMGEIHVNFGNKERAHELFEEAVKNATREAMCIIEDVRSAIAERVLDKDPAMAEVFFRSILDAKADNLHKSDLGVFNRLGIALRRQGRWQDAVTEYDRALEISPDDENLLFNKAVAYAEGSSYPGAVKAVEKALAINPDFYTDSCVLSFNIGIMYYNAKRPKEAKRFLENALVVDPGHDGARKLLESLR